MWGSSTYIAMTIARQLVPKRCVAPRKLTAHRLAMAAPKRQKPLMVIALGANQGGMRDATHNHHGLSALSKAVYSGGENEERERRGRGRGRARGRGGARRRTRG